MVTARFTKNKEFPRVHHEELNWAHGVETAVVNSATMVPILHYDEGLGAIASFNSNPEHSSYVEVAEPNCYPESTVNKIFCMAQVSLSKEALETDKVHALKFATMEIHTAFDEGTQATDEVSGLSLNDILELQTESTDRQTYPLYNGVKCKVGKAGNYEYLDADVPGLTTTQGIEGVAFNTHQYYDGLNYYSNGGKLRKIATKLKWHTLTRQNPTTRITFNQHSNTKHMNPYTGLFALFYIPKNSVIEQIGKASDTTDVNHIEINFQYRYNEFNEGFNHNLQ